MPRKSSDYYRCPHCGRRKVIYQLHPSVGGMNTDGYVCTRKDCDFGCYTARAAPQSDKILLKKLQIVNPHEQLIGIEDGWYYQAPRVTECPLCHLSDFLHSSQCPVMFNPVSAPSDF
jgi:hypothetical protein